MPDAISKQRRDIRQQIRARRQSLTNKDQQQASSQLLSTLINHPRIINAKRISVIAAHDGEIELSPFIQWCWQHQKQVYLPVVHPQQEGQLLFLEYKNNTEMAINRYGIQEPTLHVNASKKKEKQAQYLNTCSINNLDIIFTPLVAFDQQGNRIGMGGGYYDRLLSPWFTTKIGPYPIGIAHDCQYVTSLPVQKWDIPLPEIITPSHHFRF